jgi:hypothetical protein
MIMMRFEINKLPRVVFEFYLKGFPMGVANHFHGHGFKEKRYVNGGV